MAIAWSVWASSAASSAKALAVSSEVTWMCPADDRRHVVFTKRIERNVPQQYDLVEPAYLVEGAPKLLSRIARGGMTRSRSLPRV
jgi:hypothetical protein